MCGSLQQAIEFGDFTGLQHVLVTHTHEDHFDYMMMNVRKMAIERTRNPFTIISPTRPMISSSFTVIP